MLNGFANPIGFQNTPSLTANIYIFNVPYEGKIGTKFPSYENNRYTSPHHGHGGLVRMLLEREQVEVNCKDIYNWTPLSYAAEHGHAEVVRMLLEREEVDVNCKDIYNRTPLSRAAWNRNVEVAKLLLEREEKEVNCRDIGYGRTPLWWAKAGRKDVLSTVHPFEHRERAE